MILTILFILSLTISYIFYRKYLTEKQTATHPISFTSSTNATVFLSLFLTSCFWLIIIITILIGKFTTSTEDYRVALQDREGLIYASTVLDPYASHYSSPTYTPNSPTPNDLFTQIHDFNKYIISQRTYQHNLFSGWFMPNWADDIELIDYIVLNPNPIQTASPYLLAFHTGVHEH